MDKLEVPTKESNVFGTARDSVVAINHLIDEIDKLKSRLDGIVETHHLWDGS
jgi:hypothetical protein